VGNSSLSKSRVGLPPLLHWPDLANSHVPVSFYKFCNSLLFPCCVAYKLLHCSTYRALPARWCTSRPLVLNKQRSEHI
jgi:hypothetical protein